MDDALVPEGSETANPGAVSLAESAIDLRRSRRSRGPHVLLIDSDEATRKSIAGSMRHAGYEVRTAQTGAEALDSAVTPSPGPGDLGGEPSRAP